MMLRATFWTWMKSWVKNNLYQISQELLDAKPPRHKLLILLTSSLVEELMTQSPTSTKLWWVKADQMQVLTRINSFWLSRPPLTRSLLACILELAPLLSKFAKCTIHSLISWRAVTSRSSRETQLRSKNYRHVSLSFKWSVNNKRFRAKDKTKRWWFNWPK
jgi:hypothetical protein